MQPTILMELETILEELDHHEETVCAAQLQIVIDSLRARVSARNQAAAALKRASIPKGNLPARFRP